MQYSTNGRLILLAIILALLVPYTAETQQTDHYFFRHITQEDGLAHNDVSDIVQDKKGFIWIATSKISLPLVLYCIRRFLLNIRILPDSRGMLLPGYLKYFLSFWQPVFVQHFLQRQAGYPLAVCFVSPPAWPVCGCFHWPASMHVSIHLLLC